MTLTLRRATLVRVVLALLLAAAFLMALTAGRDGGGGSAVAASASPVSGKCTGQQQGVIKGDVTTKGREGTYAITSVRHGLTIPVDTQTGQASGRRQHQPLTFVTNVSQATPKLLDAMTSNENLTGCTFNFWRTDPTSGKDVNYFRIQLSDASVVSYDLSSRPGQDTVTFELTYESIEWTFVNGGITTADDWSNLAP